MITTWRPDNWEASRKGIVSKVADGKLSSSSAIDLTLKIFEAGAETMLTVLKTKAAFMTPEQMKLLAPDRKYSYGWLAFIPYTKGAKQ